MIPAPVTDPPLPTEQVPTQQTSDLRHVVALAQRNGYVAYVIPGPAPGTSTFYWGPPVRIGLPQPALSVDLGGPVERHLRADLPDGRARAGRW